jgi:hypothetical protein
VTMAQILILNFKCKSSSSVVGISQEHLLNKKP